MCGDASISRLNLTDGKTSEAVADEDDECAAERTP
jgi:hypothetical protein